MHAPPHRHLRLLLLLILLALFAIPLAEGAVPHRDAKPAYAEEQTILQLEKDQPEPGWSDAASGRRHFDRHYILPPGNMVEQDLILQRGGNTWRVWRNGPLATSVGMLLLLATLALVLMYLVVRPAAAIEARSGRKIQRFSAWDRLVHWSTAIVFVILALTGLLILFGKNLFLPLVGHDAYSWMAIISKYLHNIAGPLFVILTVLMFATYLKRNLFGPGDWTWFKRGGGMFSHRHVPAGFFNAGEKLWFWVGVTGLGIAMAISGLMLNFPNLGLTRYLLQIANVLHLVGAGFFIAFTMGHAYIGTVGTPGAYRAMRDGDVDIEWAQAHHQYWYDDVMHGSSAGELPPGPLRPLPRN
jgi:formate dehydrogenase subunit gamma